MVRTRVRMCIGRARLVGRAQPRDDEGPIRESRDPPPPPHTHTHTASTYATQLQLASKPNNANNIRTRTRTRTRTHAHAHTHTRRTNDAELEVSPSVQAVVGDDGVAGEGDQRVDGHQAREYHAVGHGKHHHGHRAEGSHGKVRVLRNRPQVPEEGGATIEEEEEDGGAAQETNKVGTFIR
jgi:hypothetical protein